MASLSDKVTATRNSVRPVSTTVSSGRSAAGTTLSCASLTGWPTATKVHGVTYQIDASSNPVAGTQIDFSGLVSGSNINSFTVLDGTDNGNSIGDIVEMLPTASWGQDLYDGFTNQHTTTGAHAAITATSMAATGAVSAGNGITMSAGTLSLTGLWDGWVGISASWTYASASSPEYTITVPSDATTTYQAGDKIKLTQGSVKYFIITKVAATVLTVYGGTDYTLANSAISAISVSRVKCPFGFPLDPTKWTVTTTNSNDCSKTSPVSGTWYGDTGLSSTGPNITIPIGVWNLRYECQLHANAGSASTAATMAGTLSTASNSETDTDLTSRIRWTGASGNTQLDMTVGRTKTLVLTSSTTYYLNIKAIGSSFTSIDLYGSSGFPTTIRAINAYL